MLKLKAPFTYNNYEIEEERYLQHCESIALIIAHVEDFSDRDTNKMAKRKIETYLKVTGAATDEL